MKNIYGFKIHLLAAFVILTLGVVMCMGIAGWVGSASLGRHLLERQARQLMNTLIEAERQALEARDNYAEEALESDKLAAVLGWKFLVGKEVPKSWSLLSTGMYFLNDQKEFVLVCDRGGTTYTLNGSLDEYYALREKVLWLLIICGSLGIAGAIIFSLFLSSYLSRPLLDLTLAVEQRREGMLPISQNPPAFPQNLLRLNNEVGVLARELAKNEAELHAFLWRESCFTGDVSHELRTPLTIMQGGLELLERDLQVMPEAVRKRNLEVIERLSRTVQGMNSTVLSLLLLARSPQNLPVEAMNIASFTWQTLQELTKAGMFTLLASERGLKDENKPENPAVFAAIETGVEVCGNPDLASVILKNLLDNALTHSIDGRVLLTLDKKMLRIVNRGELPSNINVFARGVKGSNTADSQGFGLSIALRACEKLGWKLEHGKGEGTTAFSVIFERYAEGAGQREKS